MTFDRTEKVTFGVEKTIWGYIIRPGEAAMRRAAIGEILALVCCMVFGVFAYAQWLLPGNVGSPDVLPFKMLTTVVFFVLAFLCYGIARRGLVTELQVDQRRAELREVHRNREGGTQVLRKFDFSGAVSVFIRRNTAKSDADVLMIDHRASFRPIVVAHGSLAGLEDLRESLSNDMKNEMLADMRRAEARKSNKRRQLMAAE